MTSGRWQFSLRGLLLVTSIAAVCLAIGQHTVGMTVVLVVFGVLQLATLILADWLIRPGNRRTLALWIAASWTVAGSGLAVVGIRAAKYLAATKLSALGYTFCGVSVSAGGVCWIVAMIRWRQLTYHNEEPQVRSDVADRD